MDVNRIKFLVLQCCEKPARASWRNVEKLKHCNIVQGAPIPLGDNRTITFYAERGNIEKIYHWGTRPVSKKSIMKHFKL